MGAWREGDGSTSICVQPAFAPVHYHWCRSDPSRTLIQDFEALIDRHDLLATERDSLMGEFRSTVLRLLRAGGLVPRKHIKGPMGSVTHIEVFELRIGIDRGDDGRLEFRLYHVEPSHLRRKGGSTVVGVHMHHKRTTGTGVNRAQSRELKRAADRYFGGKPAGWGESSLRPS